MMAGSREFRLVNDHQRDFPLVPRPFAAIGARHAMTEGEVIACYRDLIAAGALNRLGVVFRPNTVGASTLAAMAVPEARLEAVARGVSALPEVNHNYEREHHFNLWFVVAACSAERVEEVVAGIEARAGIAVLRLPLLEEFHIDLGFDLTDGSVPRTALSAPGRVALDARMQALVAALDGGIPLCERPYAALGMQAGLGEDAVISQLAAWSAAGVARRIGTVLHHRPLGYHANAMVVWNVPDGRVSELGRRAAQHPAVTLCYRRARAGEVWPYNLYCMVHGREREATLQGIAEVKVAAGLAAFDSATLFSRRCFTQRGARYTPSARDAAAAG